MKRAAQKSKSSNRSVDLRCRVVRWDGARRSPPYELEELANVRNRLFQEFVERKDFSRIRTSIDIPDLIEIQKRSYEEFLQLEVEPERRKDQGLQAALASVFPIPDYNNTAVLEFSSYTLGTPKYDERECLEQGMTYAVPLKLRVRLVVFDKEDKGPKKKVLDVREQEVYVGELPLMTERGRFSSTERSEWWSASCTARRRVLYA